MKREYTYKVNASVVDAKGSLASQFIGKPLIGVLVVRGKKDNFDSPSNKSFIVSGKLTEYPIPVGYDGKELVLDPIPYMFQNYAINETIDTPESSGKLTASVSQDWSSISSIKMTGSPKNVAYYVLLHDIVIEGAATDPVIVDKEDDPDIAIHANFQTPVFLLQNIEEMRGKDLVAMRESYNTVFGCLDLALPVGTGWEGVCRPHIQAGVSFDRSQTRRILDFAVENINFVSQLGYKVILVNSNESTVRKGRSKFMAGWDFVEGIGATDIYTDQNLQIEASFWDDVLQKCGEAICGIQLSLEPSLSDAISWEKRLASKIRDIGYTGKLYTGGIDDAWWPGDVTLGVGTIGGSRDIGEWQSYSLPWTDGWDMTQAEAEEWVPKFTSHPGKDGWCMYFLTDGPNGLDTYKDWITDLVWKA